MMLRNVGIGLASSQVMGGVELNGHLQDAQAAAARHDDVALSHALVNAAVDVASIAFTYGLASNAIVALDAMTRTFRQDPDPHPYIRDVLNRYYDWVGEKVGERLVDLLVDYEGPQLGRRGDPATRMDAGSDSSDAAVEGPAGGGGGDGGVPASFNPAGGGGGDGGVPASFNPAGGGGDGGVPADQDASVYGSGGGDEGVPADQDPSVYGSGRG
jgi:hypothetical protein